VFLVNILGRTAIAEVVAKRQRQVLADTKILRGHKSGNKRWNIAASSEALGGQFRQRLLYVYTEKQSTNGKNDGEQS